MCKGVTHWSLPLMRVKGRVKVVTAFDIAFDSNQRCSKAVTYLISTLGASKVRSKLLIHLTSPLIRINGICKGVTYLTYYLMRIKCGVKTVNTFIHTSKWNICKKPFSFLQDRAFTSDNIDVYTSKWNILQKNRFPFCKIAHLLVIILIFILVNGISCKKVDFLFARCCIYK